MLEQGWNTNKINHFLSTATTGISQIALSPGKSYYFLASRVYSPNPS